MMMMMHIHVRAFKVPIQSFFFLHLKDNGKRQRKFISLGQETPCGLSQSISCDKYDTDCVSGDPETARVVTKYLRDRHEIFSALG